MALEDREEIVATIQETYVLMGRAIQAEIPGEVVERALRQDAVRELLDTPIEYVTDEELLGLFQETYYELIGNLFVIQDALLDERGEKYDYDLERVGLTGSGRALKVNGFRRAFDRVRALAWSLIRCPPCWWVASAPPAFKEARMNNVVRNYT
jgi:hypothetical protein